MPGNDGYVIIRVSLVGGTGTDTTYTMERSTAGPTGPWDVLGTAIPLLGERAVFTDTTAPLGVPLWYRITGDQTGDSSVSAETAIPAAGQVWLKDPLRPWADIAFDFCDVVSSGHVEGCTSPDPEFVWAGLGRGVWQADAGLFPILNSETPADVWARQKFETNTMRFFTRTLDAIDRVYDLFTAGGPLLLQLPDEYGWHDHYVQPGDVSRDYISRDQRRPDRLWEVPITVVDRPLGPAQGTTCANWCAVRDTFPTYGDLAGAGGTFEDLLAGDVLCPDGEPTQPIQDTFSRTVVDAWGVTDTGQTWTTTGGATANYDVASGVGLMSFSATGVTMNAVIPIPGADVGERIDFSSSVVPTGNTITVGLAARENTTANLYMARVSIADTTGIVTLSLRKRVGGTETQLSTVTLPLAVAAAGWYTLRFAVSGSSLMARVWDRTLPEPGTWQTTATDTDLTAAGDAGLRVGVGTVTNPLPVILSFDNLWVAP